MFFLLLLILLIPNIANSYHKRSVNSIDLNNKPKNTNYIQNNLDCEGREIKVLDTDLQDSVISYNGNFKIFFDRTGYNAPDELDDNNNNIPDYIDSVAHYFELLHNIYINQYGFKNPIIPVEQGGKGYYSVYVKDLGNCFGWYGIADPQPPQLFIDNNYSQLDSLIPVGDSVMKKAYSTYGINALKVTIAHEFFHSIQFMYSLNSTSTFMEMMATAMESYFFPEIKDYYQYWNKYASSTSSYSIIKENNPDGEDKLNGYIISGFVRFLLLKYDIGLLKDYLEKLELGSNDYEALEFAVNKRNSTLKTEWCEFSDWAYHTGNRAIEGYGFPDSREMREVQFTNLNFSENAYLDEHETSELFSFGLVPFSSCFYRFYMSKGGIYTDDTLDIYTANVDLEKLLVPNPVNRKFDFVLSREQQTNYQVCEGLEGYYTYLNANDTNICNTFYPMPGNSTVAIDNPFPQPYRTNDNNFMYFPVPKSAKIYDRAAIEILDVRINNVIYQNRIPVIEFEGKRVIKFSPNENNIGSGVYLYRVVNKNEEKFGKFSVID